MNNTNFDTERKGRGYRIRRSIQKLAAKVLSQKIITAIYYRIVMKKKLKLTNPETFNEKIQWYKLYYCPNNELVVKCSDKYAVREYLKECGCEKYLNPLIGVWKDAQEIDWSNLPDKFAIKCNHGCSYNIICGDKKSLDKKETIRTLNRWMKDDFGLYNIEPHYDKIIKKIICEMYIETTAGDLPVDYKIYCFDGVPKLILVCSERERKLKLSFFDLDWNILNIGSSQPDRDIKKPELLDEAIGAAAKLSKGFPFVRVDLYDCETRIIFGELSFTPAAGMADYYTEEGDIYTGKMFNLPMKA